jgi:hypothetical protein
MFDCAPEFVCIDLNDIGTNHLSQELVPDRYGNILASHYLPTSSELIKETRSSTTDAERQPDLTSDKFLVAREHQHPERNGFGISCLERRIVQFKGDGKRREISREDFNLFSISDVPKSPASFDPFFYVWFPVLAITDNDGNPVGADCDAPATPFKLVLRNPLGNDSVCGCQFVTVLPHNLNINSPPGQRL